MMTHVTTLVMLTLAWVGPVIAQEQEKQSAADIGVRVVQATGEDVLASDAAGAIQPERLTQNADGVTVYTAPAGKALLLDGRVLPPPKVKPEGAPSKLDESGPEFIVEKPGAWEEIAAPRLICLSGQQAQMRVGAQIAYLDRREDGSLVVKHLEEAEGLDVEVTVGEVTKSAVELKSLSVKLTRVVGREPIEGVPFDVGRPILKTLAVTLAFRLSPETVVIMALPRKGEEQVVYVLFRAEGVTQ